MQLFGLPELLKVSAFAKDTWIWSLGRTKTRTGHLFSSKRSRNDQTLANCLQLCSKISPFGVSKVKHIRTWTNNTLYWFLNDICNFAFLPLHILNCFCSKPCLKSKLKNLEPYKRSSADFGGEITYVLEHLYFSKLFFPCYCQEKRSFVECFSTEAQVYNIPCWLYIKDTKY